jgi:hypothetical protein
LTITPAIWATARWHDCPDGHADPRTGRPARMIVPDRSGLKPHCTVCHQPMTPAGDPLAAQWRLDECCFPSGPDSTWAGPPRDPAACGTCYGTRARPVCLACYAANCDGDHQGACLACDGTRTQSCEACDGEGRTRDESGDDTGPCTAPGCAAGQLPCETCGGSGREHPA